MEIIEQTAQKYGFELVEMNSAYSADIGGALCTCEYKSTDGKMGLVAEFEANGAAKIAKEFKTLTAEYKEAERAAQAVGIELKRADMRTSDIEEPTTVYMFAMADGAEVSVDTSELGGCNGIEAARAAIYYWEIDKGAHMAKYPKLREKPLKRTEHGKHGKRASLAKKKRAKRSKRANRRH